jgi:hypothetical protein
MGIKKDIFEEVKAERQHQDALWGKDFDSKNTINDWVAYICEYATRASSYNTSSDDDRRDYFIKVAALAFGALEAFQENGGWPKRHYDE